MTTNLNINLPYYPHPYQQEFHLSDKRFRIVVGGRRSGKSLSAFYELLRGALTKNRSLNWWVAPTHAVAKEIGWDFLLNICEQLSPLIQTFKSNQLLIEFINGSRIQFKSADNPQSLRGRGLDLLVIDEAAFIKEEAWSKVLRPALTDRNGKAIFSTTPNGRNWLFDLVNKNLPNWQSFHWPTHLNPYITTEDLDEAKALLNLIDYRQEYLGEFVSKAGQVYEDFSPIDNVISNYSPTKNTCEIYLGADFGYANPTAITFFSVDRITGNVIQFDEIYQSRTTIETLIQLIITKLNSYGLAISDVSYIYTDPAGNAEELSSGVSPVDAIRKKGFNVLNKGTRIAPGLALVRSYILNAAGQRRFFVDNRCKESIRSLQGYQYKTISDIPTEEAIKDNVNDHCCDSIRYFFVNRFDTNRYVTDNVIQLPWTKNKPTGHMFMKRCNVCKDIFPSKTDRYTAPFVCDKHKVQGVSR